jgi:PAS domain S-box-containing protein
MDADNDPSESLQDQIAWLKKRVAELEHAEALRVSEAHYQAVSECTSPGHTTSIAERRHAEAALMRSEQKYKALVQSIDAIVWEADAQTFEFSFISKQAEQLLGYPAECWTISAHFWADHLHPDDRESAIAFCLAATRERQNHELEYRMIAADGREVWLHDRVTVVAYDDEPVRLRGIMFDISSHKRAEAALQHLNEVTRTLSESLDIQTLIPNVVRLTAELVKADAGALAILAADGQKLSLPYRFNYPDGLGRQPVGRENRGLAWHIVATGESVLLEDYRVHPEAKQDQAWIKGFLGVPVIAGGAILGALYVLNTDPHKRFSARDLALVESIGRQAGVALQNARLYAEAQREIGARTQALAAQRESEARFSTVFRASPVAISISTLADGRHLDVNDSYLAMIGYRREEVIGHIALDLQLWVWPEDRERMVQALRQHGSVRNLEVRQRTKSGQLRDVLASVELIELGGEPCILVFLHDITARKRAERRLAVQYAVSRVLVESADLAAAAPQLLQTIGENLEWELGVFWCVDRHAGVLRCSTLWHPPAVIADPVRGALSADDLRAWRRDTWPRLGQWRTRLGCRYPHGHQLPSAGGRGAGGLAWRPGFSDPRRKRLPRRHRILQPGDSIPRGGFDPRAGHDR